MVQLLPALMVRWVRSSAKLLRQLSGSAAEVVGAIRKQLEDFQQHLPLVTALRNPGLRDRHWEKLTASVGFPVKADAGARLCFGCMIAV
jgi:dynein heavy chain